MLPFELPLLIRLVAFAVLHTHFFSVRSVCLSQGTSRKKHSFEAQKRQRELEREKEKEKELESDTIVDITRF